MTGTAIRPRPTTYRGIQMRSRLEADYAAHLDGKGVEWEYEPKCFAGPGGQWLPDFHVTRGAWPQYIEVKPLSILDDPHGDDWVGDRISRILARMEIALLSEPSAMLTLDIYEYQAGSRWRFVRVPSEHRPTRKWLHADGWAVHGSGFPVVLAWPWKCA